MKLSIAVFEYVKVDQVHVYIDIELPANEIVVQKPLLCAFCPFVCSGRISVRKKTLIMFAPFQNTSTK